MNKIFISFPIHPKIINKLKLLKLESTFKHDMGLDFIVDDVFYGAHDGDNILYVPTIGIKQIADEQHDSTIVTLKNTLEVFQPRVLIAGSNAVPGFVIRAWRKAVGLHQKLLVIRRGVDTRAIDKVAATECNVCVDNLPGINSPYVAEHMIRHLKFKQAKPKSKVAVVGVGNIGKNIALEAIAQNLNVFVLSQSLLKKNTSQKQILEQRGIDLKHVTCADSIEHAITGATHVAISVPWEHPNGGLNASIISAQHIQYISNHCRVVSASHPRVFSPEMLAFMNQKVKLGELFVRIDTAKRLAKDAKNNYPNLEITYNEAFADQTCQHALDQAWLKKIKVFIAS